MPFAQGDSAPAFQDVTLLPTTKLWTTSDPHRPDRVTAPAGSLAQLPRDEEIPEHGERHTRRSEDGLHAITQERDLEK